MFFVLSLATCIAILNDRLISHACLYSRGEVARNLTDGSDGLTATSPTEELAKVLSRLGYPQAEEGMKPSQMLPKAINCVAKRLKKLAEYIPESSSASAPSAPAADPVAKKSAATKEALTLKSLGSSYPNADLHAACVSS